MDETVQFGDLERRILTFEEEWARTHPRTGHANSGPKLSAIVEAFPELPSTTRYYQVLNRLLDMEEAAKFKPALVERLRRRREVGRAARAEQTRVAQEHMATRSEIPEETRPVATSLLERCEMLSDVCRKAGLRAGPGGGSSRATPQHVVVSPGEVAKRDGYYRLVPGVGEAVTVYYAPPNDAPVHSLGHALSHARAAGLVLDHIAGVHA